MKKTIVYFVAKENGKLVCGPFRNVKFAEKMAIDYSNQLYGICHVEKRVMVDIKK